MHHMDRETYTEKETKKKKWIIKEEEPGYKTNVQSICVRGKNIRIFVYFLTTTNAIEMHLLRIVAATPMVLVSVVSHKPRKEKRKKKKTESIRRDYLLSRLSERHREWANASAKQ